MNIKGIYSHLSLAKMIGIYIYIEPGEFSLSIYTNHFREHTKLGSLFVLCTSNYQPHINCTLKKKIHSRIGLYFEYRSSDLNE